MSIKLKAVLCAVTVFCVFFAENGSLYAASADSPGTQNIVFYQSEWDYPPFKYIDDYSLTGFDIDLSKMIFRKEDYNLAISMNDWEYVYNNLKSGQIDTCGMLVVNEKRKDEILYSKTIFESCISVYSKVSYSGKGINELKLEDIGQYKIGVGKEQYSEEILTDKLGIKPFKTYNTIEEAIDGLKNEEIDLLFENQQVVNYLLIQKDMNSAFEVKLNNLFPVGIAYGISKNRPDLVKYINKRVSELKRSGFYEELYLKYFYMHSSYYYSKQRNTIIFTTTLILLILAVVFLLLHMYISYLRKRLIREQGFSKSIIANAKTMILVCDSEGTIAMFNKFTQEVSGYTAEEAEGKKVYEIPFLNEGTDAGKQIFNSLSAGTLMQNLEACLITRDRKPIYILWNMDVIKDSEGKLASFVAMGIDITERKNTEYRLTESYQELESTHEELLATEEELKQQYDDLNLRDNELKRSEERYRLAVEGVNDGIWDWDGKDGKLFMSKRSRLIMGFDMNCENTTIEEWFGIILKEDLDRFAKNFNKYITEPQKKHFQFEYRINPADGSIKWIRTRGMGIWDETGIPVRMAGSNTDITDQKLSDDRIHQLAYYDSMTGLPNRALLMDRFIIAVANAQRKGRMVAVYFLDLDNFKSINDTIGHSFGDQLLLRVGEQLKLKMRKSDTIARLGGDEFIMLQANVRDMDEVYHLAARMLEIFKQPWVLDEHEFYVTASIGISVYPNDGPDFQELMKNADAAMYRAKETGKNNFQIYTHELNLRIMERMEIENHLRKAIERNEFILYYQPQIELATGRVTGVEALIRWSNPVLGWVLPDAFIYIAEEIGMINAIGEWVLRSACTQLARWHAEGFDGLKMSVNLSVKQFQQIKLVELITGIIEESGIKAELLELEITESVALQDLEHTISILQGFRTMGIGISLDDFGKGYSSLNYLKLLPINNLKIDKTFIHDITSNSNQAKIAKALISLAHNMNLTVTAEGVENSNQLEFLKKENCDIAQGYLFSRPKPVNELELSSYKT